MASGKKVNVSMSGGGGGLSLGGSNSLGSKFPTLFGQIGYSGFNQEKSFNGMEGDDGEVGFGESIVPVWGAGRMATQNFKKGEWGWGIFNTIMAISDLALVKSILTGIVKGGLKALTLGNLPWSSREAAREIYKGNILAYRPFYGQPYIGKNAFAQKGQHVHHWFIEQNSFIGKLVPNFIKHQMWNLKPLPLSGVTIKGVKYEMEVLHNALHGRGALNLSNWQKIKYGTPNYVYPLGISSFGKGVNYLNY